VRATTISHDYFPPEEPKERFSHNEDGAKSRLACHIRKPAEEDADGQDLMVYKTRRRESKSLH